MNTTRSSKLARAGVRILVFCCLGVLAVLAGWAGESAALSAAAPTNTALPTISGTLQDNQMLTASPGTWTGTGSITYQYSWRRCARNGGSCSGISGATSSTYLLKKVDVGNTLRIRVTATDTGGSRPAVSVPTAVVTAAAAPAPPVTNGCPASPGSTVQVSDVNLPALMTVDQQQVSPSTITPSTRTLTARFHVSACGASVQGALVYVTAVPYGQFAIPNEQPTGADGWATLDFQALKGFPVSKAQRLLVMFVRARKSGENILGGISTRRLISFRVAP